MMRHAIDVIDDAIDMGVGNAIDDTAGTIDDATQC